MLGSVLHRLAPGGAILCYHSLLADPGDAAGVANVPIAEFEDVVTAVLAGARAVPLGELLDRLRRGRSTRGLLAVTFDDAYESLRTVGSPVFRRHALPVTVFPVAASCASAAPFWWDRLDDLRERVPLERWRRFEDALGLPDAYRRGQPADEGPGRPLRQWLLREHRGRWPASLEVHLAALEAEVGTRTRQRPMRWEELAAFAADPLVSVGVHTVSHPVLPLLSDEEGRAEIADAHAALRERLPGTLPVLAIPFGFYDARTVTLARDAGMSDALVLDNRVLRRARPAAHGVSRISITRRTPAWRQVLRATGVVERVRGRTGAPAFPVLPSPTS